MREIIRRVWRPALLAGLLLLVFSTLAVQMTVVQPVAAQEPTPTPNDPVWILLDMSRKAIEKKYNVNLSIIREYSWENVEYKNGIESCIEPENRSGIEGVYFGTKYFVTSLNGTKYEVRIGKGGDVVVACDPIAQDSAPANNPAPIAGGAALQGFSLGGHVLEMSDNTFGLMRRAGMTWVKKQINYNEGDDPGGLAGFINRAHEGGFRILFGIVGDEGRLAQDFDGYLNTYVGYLAGVASLGADAIEVWNEPNIDREWPAGQINGANYTKMLAAAYNAIKSANPNTWVISAAPSPTGFFGAAGCGSGGCNDDVFMQQMAAAGAAQYLDCIGLHYNEGIIPPSQQSNDPRGNYPTYFFSSMLARGYNPFGGKPVCFTELGYLSGEGFDIGIPANFAWANNTTVAQHASWLAEAATIAAQSGKVRLMIVWNVDFPFFTENDPMGGYAMFRPDGSCPACDTLGAVMGK